MEAWLNNLILLIRDASLAPTTLRLVRTTAERVELLEVFEGSCFEDEDELLQAVIYRVMMETWLFGGTQHFYVQTTTTRVLITATQDSFRRWCRGFTCGVGFYLGNLIPNNDVSPDFVGLAKIGVDMASAHRARA